MKRSVVKTAFYIFCAALWCCAVAGMLEVVAYILQTRIEALNPYIADYKMQKPNQPFTGVIQVAASETFVPERIGGWDANNQSPPDDPSRMAMLAGLAAEDTFDSESRSEQRLRFPTLSQTEKESYARLHGEVVILSNHKFRFLEIYGSGKHKFYGVQGLILRVLFRKSGQMAEIRNTIGETLEKQASLSLLLYYPSRKTPQELLHLVIMPSPKRGCVYIFLNRHPEAVLASPVPQPESVSRWDVPFFRYKADFRPENDPTFQTNSLGFRSSELQRPKPAGVFRVLCIGGSTTDDIGEELKTYPAGLEMLMRDALPDVCVEVMNAGTPGITSEGHLLRLPDYLSLEPDMAIIHLGVNDTIAIYDNPLTNVLPIYSRFCRLLFPAILAPSAETFSATLEADMGQNLRLLTEQFQKAGVAVVYASMPFPDPVLLSKEQRQYHDYRGKQAWALPSFSLGRYAEYLRISNRLLSDMAAQFHAMYVPLAEGMAPNVDLYNDFCHMKQAGINAKAEIIFNSIFPVVLRRFEQISFEGAPCLH